MSTALNILPNLSIKYYLLSYLFLKITLFSWAVVAHTFKPRTWEAEADRYLSSRPAWSTQWAPGKLDYTGKPCLKKTKQIIFTEVCEQCATVHSYEGQSGHRQGWVCPKTRRHVLWVLQWAVFSTKKSRQQSECPPTGNCGDEINVYYSILQRPNKMPVIYKWKLNICEINL